MKKRIISLILASCVVLSLLAMPVNADMVFKEDYAGFLDTQDVVSATETNTNCFWKPYTASTTGISFDNETVKIAKTSENSPIYDIKYNAQSENYVLMFDMKQNVSFLVDGYLYASPSRFPSFVINPTANEWYSHLVQVKKVDGTTKGYYYRKLKTDTAYTFVSELTYSSASSETMLRINISGASNVGRSIWIDNVELHENFYAKSLSVKTNDGVEINALSEIPSGTTSISAEMQYFDADFAAGNLSAAKTVLPALVVLDKNGRLLDCAMSNETIAPLENPAFAPLTVDISGYAAQIDKIQLLMWDTLESMQPVIDTIEIK